MAWKETCVMDERLSFVHEVERGERSVAELCRVFGISRKTGYKWIGRFRQEGEAALVDRSRAPRTHPNVTDEAVAQLIVQGRRRHPDWGPEKLLDWLAPRHRSIEGWPAVSTAAEILKRAGLVKARRRIRTAIPFRAPFTQVDKPNSLWSADFKGYFKTGDGRYCHPLTITDNYSRYLIACQSLLRYTSEEAMPWFERAFREYGLPQAIRTDNGTPFGSTGLGGLTKLNVWWLRLGIVPEHIEPGKPQQNGRHERMHGTLKRAVGRPRLHAAAQQAPFDRFRLQYNHERPHHALAGATPASHYAPSPRPYPKRLAPFTYPSDVIPRHVLRRGKIHWLGHKYYVGRALGDEIIGLREIEDAVWLVIVGPIAVGKLDVRHHRVEPIEPYLLAQKQGVTHVPGNL
jgi:transposase InsO family protein